MWEIEEDKNKNKEYRLPCRSCDGKTYHKVLKSVHTYASDGDIDVWDDYEIVCCQGCKNVSFRSKTMCSENVVMDQETGEEFLAEDIELYPNRIAGRKQIRDVYSLPFEVRQIYNETHIAVCNRSNILAGIGIRALVEAVCKEKNAKGNNLEKRIDDLAIKNVLTQEQADTLHSTRLIGNKSAHEIIAPHSSVLDIAMDIVENLIKTVYIIPKKAKGLAPLFKK